MDGVSGQPLSFSLPFMHTGSILLPIGVHLSRLLVRGPDPIGPLV